MKNYRAIINSIHIPRELLFRAALCMILFSPAGVWAQADTSKPAETTKEEPALIAPSLEFTTLQKSDNTIDLKAALQAKVKGSPFRLYGMKVTFLQVTDTAERTLGSVITNGRGIALLNYKADSLTAGKEGKINLKAVFAGNNMMEPADGEVSIKRARLEITPVKEDSLLTVQLKLVDLSTGTETPLKETDLAVYVKRMINPLKVGEGKTDENGTVTVEIPNTLPGDINGNITLLARLDESETYGMLEADAAPQKWGIPVSDKIDVTERALWSAHPPIWMLITFIVLMTTVWGHYIVIVYELFRLRKEEPHEAPHATKP